MGARDVVTTAPLAADGYASPAVLWDALSRALAPRKPLTVSQWADLHRRLSSKGSSQPGQWATSRNPPLREPMDMMSARSTARDVVLMFPIQFGKTEVAINTLGYVMDHHPGPVMVTLPGEASMNAWIAQKLQPMLDETPRVRAALSSTASRDGANRREFKDFASGQLFVEHAGSPARLKSKSVRTLIVDEIDEFANALTSGDDPVSMLDGRTSAFPATYKRLYISTPTLKGISRIEQLWNKSDQRRYHVPCPHCGHEQHLQWAGLHWAPGGKGVHYVCADCGAAIEEHHKPQMIAAGRWIAGNPEARIRGYHVNALYYQPGLGPRWADLVEMWLDAQADPSKLKTFVNDRLAEPWEDPTMRAVKHNAIADRAEPYALGTAPEGVLVVTAGVDTQDNRLAVQRVGWGRGMAFWVLDYVELPGDPADPAVWTALTALLQQPIQHASGATLRVQAVAIDAGGHRTEAVKGYARERRVNRPMAIFGAVQNNAPPLSKPKAQDVTWRGATDKRGVLVYHVGTVALKHWLFSRLSVDADREPADRATHFTAELDTTYFTGLVSETFNPARNRFDKRRGARNEPLDTWVYAAAAAHHPELRLHRYTRAQWDQIEQRLAAQAAGTASPAPAADAAVPQGSAEADNPAGPTSAPRSDKIPPAAPASPPAARTSVALPRHKPNFAKRW